MPAERLDVAAVLAGRPHVADDLPPSCLRRLARGESHADADGQRHDERREQEREPHVLTTDARAGDTLGACPAGCAG